METAPSLKVIYLAVARIPIESEDMLFGGIQKLTLLDYPDKTACTLFTVGCNFRCPFCHNATLIASVGNKQTMDSTEVLAFLKRRQGLLDGVCISGGEPLLHPRLGDFIRQVKELGFLVKLDTNGSLPDRLIKLVRSGTIDYVAMDIKNTPQKYAFTIGAPRYDLASVVESVAFLLTGTLPYEFRTTVVRELHTVDDLRTIAQWLAGTDKYCLQAFVDSGDVLESGLSGYSPPEMQSLLHTVKTIIPNAELRGI